MAGGQNLPGDVSRFCLFLKAGCKPEGTAVAVQPKANTDKGRAVIFFFEALKPCSFSFFFFCFFCLF